VHSSDPAPEPRHFVVLVIEDDAAIRELIAHAALEEPGMQVLAARDGAEGLAAFEQIRPDVVLLDLQLPGLDGIEVCRRLKSDPTTAEVPIVGFSAGTNEATARQAGCDDFVAKPFELDDLMGRLRRWLRREAAEGEAGDRGR
jgi:DNA-binding response OmpR family regulator